MINCNPEKKNCTGCTACEAICPIQCIKMARDEEGFAYPVQGPACIHCGKCETVCPILNSDEWMIPENISLEQAYCGITKNQKIWNDSASGGAFTEICRAFGDDQTAVYGAVWDGLHVTHRRVVGINAIAPLRKSKYVESYLGACFKQIAKDLQDGKRVIFTGTPCEVAGLKRFIHLIPDELLLIDLICHGAGSPSVFQKCLDQISDQFQKKVVSYEFRAKRGYHETDYLTKIEFEDRSTKYIVDDPYMQLFLQQNCLRPSCGKNCRFRCEYRQGDITIADFKSLTKVFPDLVGVKKNYSSIVFNTAKGSRLLKRLKSQMDIRECDIEAIKESNPLFCRQTVFSTQRDGFFEAFCKDPDKTIVENTHPATVLTQTRFQIVSAHIPLFIRRLIINTYMKRKTIR